MRRSPSIVPQNADHDTYLVLNDFGRHGRAWCETDEEDTNRETLIRDLMDERRSLYNQVTDLTARIKSTARQA